MTEKRSSEPETIGEKRGFPVYESNPSVPLKGGIARNRKRQLGNERKGLVIDDGTGEILGRGVAIAYEWEEVDAEKFVKLYLAGVKQAGELTKPGLLMFEVVYKQLRDNPNTDSVNISLYTAQKLKPELTDRNYQRGLRELLEKKFLFHSPYGGVFFVNIQYIFNGDRLAFVQGYHLKGAKPQPEQLSLLPPD
jgi:hypothetical protein